MNAFSAFFTPRHSLPMAVVMGLCAGLPSLAHAQQPTDSFNVGTALEVIFDAHRTPPERTMGLFRGSFLDLAQAIPGPLEVALVVDGTDSMAKEIDGVRKSLSKLIEDLNRWSNNQAKFSLVVYRDAGAESGEVEVRFPGFTKEVSDLHDEVAKIKPESGKPYFPELIDLGIHKALTELNWSTEKETARWIFVFGDAPPFGGRFVDAKKNAVRRYSNDVLVRNAQEKDIRINCILCESRPENNAEEVLKCYQESLPDTRRFMNELASKTKGEMLDLSRSDIQKLLARAAKKPRVDLQSIGEITEAQLAEIRRKAFDEKSPEAENRRIRVAVLPHGSLRKPQLADEQPEVQFATEMRTKLGDLRGVEVSSSSDVEEEFLRLMDRGELARSTDVQIVQKVGALLGVDYVIWGSYRQARGQTVVDTALYGQGNSTPLAKASANSSNIEPIRLAGNVANRLFVVAQNSIANAPRDRRLAQHGQKLALVFNDLRNRQNFELTPVANVASAQSELLIGLQSLEKSLEMTLAASRSPELGGLLQKAQTKLESAYAKSQQAGRPDGYTLWLLANCYYNQWSVMNEDEQSKDSASAKGKWKQFETALGRANRLADSLPDQLQKEVAAGFALVVDRDFREAIRLYKELTEKGGATRKRHAHWMLAQIYCGDWNVDKDLINVGKAREHLANILALWPDSAQGQYLRHVLHWDNGEATFPHYPRKHNVASVQ